MNRLMRKIVNNDFKEDFDTLFQHLATGEEQSAKVFAVSIILQLEFYLFIYVYLFIYLLSPVAAILRSLGLRYPQFSLSD